MDTNNILLNPTASPPLDTKPAPHLATATPLGGRNNNFNLLRLLFAIFVLLSHAPELIDGDRRREILSRIFHTISFGELAVNGFFLLSGFMIIKSWNSQPIVVEFLKKRVFRIYPGYLAAAILSAFVFGLLGARNPLVYLHTFNYTKLLSSLLFLEVPVTPATFVGTSSPSVNGAMWSLASEFRCYLIIATLGVVGMNKRRWVWATILTGALLLSLALFFIGNSTMPHKDFIIGQLGLFTRLFLFFSAGACFNLYQHNVVLKAKYALLALPILGYLLFFPAYASIALTIFGGYIIFCFAYADIKLLDVFKTSPDISYGIYLYGWPVQKLILWYFPSISPWLLFPVSLLFSSILGYFSWILVESPALKWIAKTRLYSPKATTAPA